jgi:L-histidine Nalpha-methyltransferase
LNRDTVVASPDPREVRAEIAARLSARPRSLPARFFYDEAGARLFQEITRLEEYYLTDAEVEILAERAPEVARRVGRGVRMVEYGSGSGEKTWIVLDHLEAPAAYVPVDVAARQLQALADRVAERHPGLRVIPVAADYTRLDTLPWPEKAGGTTLAFFPGSTIGNLEPGDAVAFLRRIRRQAGEGVFLLVGADLAKDPGVLERAYDDPRGVTARFNLNILSHLNRLIGADFDPAGFRHRAVWNADASRIEMHLVSVRRQEVAVGPGPDAPRFTLEKGEAIVTEHSYKYRLEEFEALARRGGFRTVQAWTDRKGRFSVHLLEAAE